MKGFLNSTLIRFLTVLVMLASAIPLTDSITHLHAASASSQTSWNIVSSPNPGAPTSSSNGLNAVTTYSSTDAWTVGNYHGSTNDQSLIEHWNGKSWTQQTSPNPG